MLRLPDIKKGDKFFEVNYGLKVDMEALEDCKVYKTIVEGKELNQYSVLIKWSLPHGSGETELSATESYEGYGPQLYRYE